MDSLRRLEELFAHFPGIGPRQARRFVYYILSRSPTSIQEFIHLIEEVKKSSAECSRCHRFFIQGSNIGSKSAPSKSSQKGDGVLCTICSDPSRDQTSLMVVARDSDFETVEKSGAYRGLYFILGGSIPVLDKEPEKRIRLEKLLQYISGSPTITEVILSLNTTPDGEHTGEIVKNALEKISVGKNVKISILGRGLSTGAELEYVDGETIRNALQNRH